MKLLFRRFTHKQAHHFPPYHIGSALTTFCRGGVILILTIFRFRARRWIPPFRGSLRRFSAESFLFLSFFFLRSSAAFSSLYGHFAVPFQKCRCFTGFWLPSLTKKAFYLYRLFLSVFSFLKDENFFRND